MKEERKIKVQKKLKGNKGLLVGTLVAFLIVIAMCIWIYTIQNEELAEPYSMHDIIASKIDRENEYVKIDAQLLTECFATYGDGSSTDKRYYFASDGTYTYILNLTLSQFDELKTIYEYTYNEDENTVAPEPIKVTGLTNFIPEDIRKIAIEAYNEMMEEEILTEENFDSYIGPMCIKVGSSPRDDYDWQLLVALFAGVIGIIMMTTYLSYRSITKRTLKKYEDHMEEIYQELEAEETSEYDKQKLYITKNYVVDLSTGLTIIKLSDIEWMYPHEFRQNGITTIKSIILVTSDGKKSQVAKMDAVSKKSKEIYEEVYTKIAEKIPSAMFGYTRENARLMKEKEKERKQNRL